MENIIFPNISRVENFTTRKEWESVAWDEFTEWLSKQNLKTVKTALEFIMSPSEREIITRRATALNRFQNGATYREIGRELWLTQQTIRSIKKTFLAKSYSSNWVKVKIQQKARSEARLKKRFERPEQKFYRRTKYGKLRIYP